MGHVSLQAVNKPKKFMVTSTAKMIDIFDSVLEIHHLDRNDVINQLIKLWLLKHTEPDLHRHINKALSPARYTQV